MTSIQAGTLTRDMALRIGVIGGAGWLGSALVTALLDAGIAKPANVSLSYRSQRPDLFPEAFWTTDNQSVADRSDVIILCVRPADWSGVMVDAGGKLVMSVMAGVRLAALCDRHKTRRVVRSLPNAAAEVRKSYTPWIATDEITDDDREVVRAIFAACGIEDEVRTEADIDYLTGLTGSGPAFPALLAKAMMDHAQVHGLERDVAQRAVNMLIVGAGRLLERQDACPGETVQTFLDYRGTTAAAIEAMLAAGFDTAVEQGLSAALSASVRMGDAS